MAGSRLIELEAVLAVARLGGFRAAARELEMSPSALSHVVAALETRLSVRLFNRTTRSVALSSAGEQFVAQVGPAFAAIRSAMDGVNEHSAEPTGRLRLNTSLGAARMILQPLLLEYLRRHPQMQVEVATEGALVDIVAKGFDAGVRLAEAVPADMIAVPIQRSIRSIVVGAPAYFEGRTRPATPDDLMAHRCIRARMASGVIYRWEFEKRGESLTVDVPGALTLDDSDLMRQAALGGAGLAFLAEPSVKRDLDAGRLVQVLDDWTPPYPGLCLYHPSRRHMPASLRAFVALVREAAGA